MEYGAVPPLIVTVEIEPVATVTEFGLAIMLATVTGTLTVDAPALSLTTMFAVPSARPVTVSVVPDILDLTFVVSEFDCTEYGTLPPDRVTIDVLPTSSETDVGLATKGPVLVSPELAGLSVLPQPATKNIVIADIMANAMIRSFFVTIQSSMNDDNARDANHFPSLFI
jgi:hypothetical protein